MKIAKDHTWIIKIVMILVVVIGLGTAAGATYFASLYENSFFADKKFEELSKSYFENKVYKEYVDSYEGKDLSEIFSGSKNRFQVKLRQVINYELLEHNENYRSYFETDVYSCDTNRSYATFTMHEPYGKTDYDVEYKLECEKHKSV